MREGDLHSRYLYCSIRLTNQSASRNLFSWSTSTLVTIICGPYEAAMNMRETTRFSSKGHRVGCDSRQGWSLHSYHNSSKQQQRDHHLINCIGVATYSLAAVFECSDCSRPHASFISLCVVALPGACKPINKHFRSVHEIGQIGKYRSCQKCDYQPILIFGWSIGASLTNTPHWICTHRHHLYNI